MTPANEKRGELVRGLFIDGSFVSGFGLVSYGSWSIYHPAGFIAAGALLLAFFFLGGVRR